MPEGKHPVLLFDGVCNLCNGAINWVIDRDTRGKYRFAPLQSGVAKEAVEAAGVKWESLPDSFILIDGKGVHTRSEAALRVAIGLGWPWKAMAVFLPVPRWLRDGVYAWVARNRYRWFGKQEQCRIPTPELRSRFLG